MSESVRPTDFDKFAEEDTQLWADMSDDTDDEKIRPPGNIKKENSNSFPVKSRHNGDQKQSFKEQAKGKNNYDNNSKSRNVQSFQYNNAKFHGRFAGTQNYNKREFNNTNKWNDSKFKSFAATEKIVAPSKLDLISLLKNISDKNDSTRNSGIFGEGKSREEKLAECGLNSHLIESDQTIVDQQSFSVDSKLLKTNDKKTDIAEPKIKIPDIVEEDKKNDLIDQKQDKLTKDSTNADFITEKIQEQSSASNLVDESERRHSSQNLKTKIKSINEKNQFTVEQKKTVTNSNVNEHFDSYNGYIKPSVYPNASNMYSGMIPFIYNQRIPQTIHPGVGPNVAYSPIPDKYCASDLIPLDEQAYMTQMQCFVHHNIYDQPYSQNYNSYPNPHIHYFPFAYSKDPINMNRPILAEPPEQLVTMPDRNNPNLHLHQPFKKNKPKSYNQNESFEINKNTSLEDDNNARFSQNDSINVQNYKIDSFESNHSQSIEENNQSTYKKTWAEVATTVQ